MGIDGFWLTPHWLMIVLGRCRFAKLPPWPCAGPVLLLGAGCVPASLGSRPASAWIGGIWPRPFLLGDFHMTTI